MIEIKDRVEGAIYGLAFGDGIGAPSATNRLGILAPKRIMRMRSLSEFADDRMQTTRPVPYTHAQPSTLLNPAPSDDVEWFAFVMNYVSRGEAAKNTWKILANDYEDIRARTGTKIALKNLINGLEPPESGHDNPHYFDDIALVRAAAIALIHFGDPNSMLRLIDEDITITHSEDGLFCARAFANLLATLLRGGSKEEAIKFALNTLPRDSWSERLVSRALELTRKAADNFDRALLLEEDYVEKIYAYAISAPETLGLLLAHFENTETAEELFNSTLLHKRNLDSLPPLAGLLAGVHYGNHWLPKRARRPELSIAGVCLPMLKGLTLGELVNYALKNLE